LDLEDLSGAIFACKWPFAARSVRVIMPAAPRAAVGFYYPSHPLRRSLIFSLKLHSGRPHPIPSHRLIHLALQHPTIYHNLTMNRHLTIVAFVLLLCLVSAAPSPCADAKLVNEYLNRWTSSAGFTSFKICSNARSCILTKCLGKIKGTCLTHEKLGSFMGSSLGGCMKNCGAKRR